MNDTNTQTIHRVMHEIKRRKLEVLRVVDLTPRMRRITVGGPELAGFISLGSDDHVKLFFPQNEQELAALETLELGAGKKTDAMPPMRDYTPRRSTCSTPPTTASCAWIARWWRPCTTRCRFPIPSGATRRCAA